MTVAGLGSGKGDRSRSFRNPTWILDPEGRRANLEKTKLSKSEDIRGGKEREPEGGDKSVGLVRKKMPQKQRGRSEPENVPYFRLTDAVAVSQDPVNPLRIVCSSIAKK